MQELTGYLEKTLDPNELAELNRHVRECPNCFVVCDTTEKTLKVLKGMDCKPIPKEIEDRLMQAVERAIAAKAKSCGCSDQGSTV